jgi:hypothetical protein
MGSWLFRNWHGNGLNGEAYVPIPPLINTSFSLRLPPSYVLVHMSARHGDGRVCRPDTHRYAQDGEHGVLASGQGSDHSIEMLAGSAIVFYIPAFNFLCYTRVQSYTTSRQKIYPTSFWCNVTTFSQEWRGLPPAVTCNQTTRAIITHDAATTSIFCLVLATLDADSEKPRLARAVTERSRRWA